MTSWRGAFPPERVAAARRRWQQALLHAAVVGIVTGAAVAAFDVAVAHVMLPALRRLPVGVAACAPAAGLALAWLLLRTSRATPATADEYVRAYHDVEQPMPLAPGPAKVAASAATLGLGGALGFEGPSIYVGALVGGFLHRRVFRGGDRTLLLVAGAAAGVAAIFKAPATGAVFAIEVLYLEDVAAGAVLPALVAAAASYVVFAALLGTEPLLDLAAPARFGVVDLLGALLLGVAAGLGARWFSQLMTGAKALAQRVSAPVRILGAGAALAALALVTHAVYDAPLTLGPGYDAVRWAVDPAHGLALVALLFALRGAASVLTVGGGGAGGVFIPLVVQGALLGRVVGGALPGQGHVLFPLVGVAAFLGAGYRTPIAAVMFVAESTGRPGFVVPALVATAAAQLVMGRVSVSPYQRARRSGRVERRLDLAVANAVRTDLPVLDATVTLDEFVHERLVRTRGRILPVVAGETYVGLVRLRDVDAVPRAERATTPVGAVLAADAPYVTPRDTLRSALTAMQRAEVDVVAVVEDGAYAGVLTLADVLSIEEWLSAPGS